MKRDIVKIYHGLTSLASVDDVYVIHKKRKNKWLENWLKKKEENIYFLSR